MEKETPENLITAYLKRQKKSYSHRKEYIEWVDRKEYIEWVEGAKLEESRIFWDRKNEGNGGEGYRTK